MQGKGLGDAGCTDVRWGFSNFHRTRPDPPLPEISRSSERTSRTPSAIANTALPLKCPILHRQPPGWQLILGHLGRKFTASLASLDRLSGPSRPANAVDQYSRFVPLKWQP